MSRLVRILAAVIGVGVAHGQPIDLQPNVPPLRPELTGLFGLGDGGARLVALEREPEPLPGGQDGAFFDYLTAADGTVYKVGGDRAYCWPPGITGWEAAYQAGGGLQLAGLVDGRLVGWSQRAYPGGRDLVEQRFSACGPDFAVERQVRVREEGELPAFFTPWTARSSGELWSTPTGLCGVAPEGVLCRVGTDDVPEVTWWLTPEQMAERLPQGKALAEELLAASPELPQDRPIQYALRDAQRLPDGRIAALLSASLPSTRELQVWMNWLVRLDRQGDTVEALMEPAVQVLGGGFIYDNALGSAESVHYDAEWDALWVGRLLGWQPSSLILSFDTVGSINELITLGRTGGGYRIVPLGGPHAGPPRNGYLDLTNAYYWLNPCEQERGNTCVPFARLGFGAVGDRQGQIYFRPTLNLPGRALVFDRDAVDLDGDGLDQAAEVAQGTSDVAVDSDGDGAMDRLEPLVGRDPAVPDPAPEAQTPLRLITSDVWAGLEPPAGATQGRSYAPDNPLCEYGNVPEGRLGRCHDPAGRVLVEWTTDTRADTPIIAADGSYLLFTRFDGVYQLPFDTGQPVLWISAADLHARIGEDITGGPESGFAAYQTWVPVDRDTVFLATAFDPFSRERRGRFPRYERMDGAPGEPVAFTTLLDTEYDFCDAGLVRCTDEAYTHLLDGDQEGPATGRPYERSHIWTVAMGYHPDLQRFLVGVGGHQQSLVLGFHRDPAQPPARLSRARGLYPLERESYWAEQGSGWCIPFPGTVNAVRPGLHQVGPALWRGPALEPLPIRPPSVAPPDPKCGNGSTQPYVAPWGPSTAFGQQVYGRTPVTLEPQGMRPGDTLLISSVSGALSGVEPTDNPDGRMLYALGPWVTPRALWDAPDPDLVRGTGLAVADDHRVCVADRPGQQVLEFLTDADDRPALKGRRVTDVDAIACLWRGDELLVLTGEAVLAVEADGSLREEQAHGAAQPVAFALDADGALQVLDRGAPGAPAGWIRRQDGTLEPIAPDGLREGAFVNDLRVDIDGSQPSTVFTGVERPDGTVLISHSSTLAEPDPYGVEIFGVHQGVLMLDGRGGLRTVADPIRQTGGEVPWGQLVFQPIAQVPGDGPDIWGGAKGPVCWFDGSLPECQVQPGEPGSEASPDGGVGDAGPAGRPSEDSGCSCDAAHGPPAPFGVLALAFLLGWRRRLLP